MLKESIVAQIRFGLGPMLDFEQRSDPIAALQAELRAPLEPWPDDTVSIDDLFAARQKDRVLPPSGGTVGNQEAIFRREVGNYVKRLVSTRQPFRQRLTAFWFNHFTVSRRTGAGMMAPTYLREAIEPHVTGRFVDMLQAVMRHPAMLDYLNNNASIGPNSQVGLRQGRGLNENLAREALELFTISPHSGYTQSDVTQFAQILTGWTVIDNRQPFGFYFRSSIHQPGSKRLLGKYFEQGKEGGVAAINMLGTHVETYQHIALKLARHFIDDLPSQVSVLALFEALRQHDGNLTAAYDVLLNRSEIWSNPLSKLRMPQDFLIASWRLLQPEGDTVAATGAGSAGYLGQSFFNAPQPNGWPDDASAWTSPELLLRRIDWSWNQAGRFPKADARYLAERGLGPLLSDETRTALARAGNPREALTLLLASPEFQRR